MCDDIKPYESDAEVDADMIDGLNRVIDRQDAKIESDAKVIAALREALDSAINMLEESHSGYISGSRTDLEWDADRERIIEAGRIVLTGDNEQTAGESK
jgi:hypothetical protein